MTVEGVGRGETALVAPARRPIWQRVYYQAARLVFAAFLTVFHRLRIHHTERIPRSGPVILVANHQSHFDPPIVGIAVNRRQFRPVARESLFRNPVFGALIRGLNSVPLRDNEGDIGAIRVAIDLLKHGEAICLFPEGSRTPDGAMRPFKRGVTVLLRRVECPVVPIAIEGAFDAFPRHRTWPRLFSGARIVAMVGEPIAHADLMKDGGDAALERLANEIDGMRLALRARLRRQTRGKFPARGPGDGAMTPVAAPST